MTGQDREKFEKWHAEQANCCRTCLDLCSHKEWEWVAWLAGREELRASQWVSVKDGLPEQLVNVLVLNKYGWMGFGCLSDEGEWITMVGTKIEKVELWADFPPPPKENKV